MILYIIIYHHISNTTRRGTISHAWFRCAWRLCANPWCLKGTLAVLECLKMFCVPRQWNNNKVLQYIIYNSTCWCRRNWFALCRTLFEQGRVFHNLDIQECPRSSVSLCCDNGCLKALAQAPLSSAILRPALDAAGRLLQAMVTIFKLRSQMGHNMAVCQSLVPLVNIKIAGKWMFIPLKMVLIGIDPYPYVTMQLLVSPYPWNPWCFWSIGDHPRVSPPVFCDVIGWKPEMWAKAYMRWRLFSYF